MANITVATDYSTLRRKVRETLLLGQQKIEQEKARTYWETGKHINDYILQRHLRAEYGKAVILKLSKDLKIHDSVLKRCREFARAFPHFKKGANGHQLSWSHYRALLPIKDSEIREKLVSKARSQNWSAPQLEIKVRNLNYSNRTENSNGDIPKLPRPVLGNFWTYRIIRPELIHSRSKALLLDLGFKFTIEMDRFPNHSKFKPDTIVTSTKDKNGKYSLSLRESAQRLQKTLSLRATERSEAISSSQIASASPRNDETNRLYTYQAFVERVVDGDTLKVEIDLGFHNRFREIIRLKWIDAPELDTKEGKAAKKFVEDELKDVEYVTIKSTKSEKWGRWLGDVFYTPPKSKDPVYLNQLLLDRHLAVRVRS